LALVTGLAFGTTAVLAEGMQHDGHGRHGHMGERFWNKLDQNGDGKITQDELKADVTSRFSAIDTNKDGKVTQDEVAQYFTAKRDEMKAKFAERLKEADANKDGKWSKDELSKMPETHFSKLDSNSDGFVTQAELDAHRAEREARFQEKRGEHEKGGGKLFSHFDQNGDGVVDQSEALKAAESRFSKLDTNSDGAVERSELKAGHHDHGRGGKHECDHQGKDAAAKPVSTKS
jgi:Ca2+-binding EF-hand superfamily protein